MEALAWVLLGAMISYFLDFTKPWVRSIYDKSIFSTKKKRLEATKQEYREKKWMLLNPAFITPFVIREILRKTVPVLGAATTICAIDLFLAKYGYARFFSSDRDVLALVVATGSFLTVFYFRTILLIAQFLSFSEYRGYVTAKLINLGGNPDELDKIDKEFEDKQGG